jgi:hypothetical protein
MFYLFNNNHSFKNINIFSLSKWDFNLEKFNAEVSISDSFLKSGK